MEQKDMQAVAEKQAGGRGRSERPNISVRIDAVKPFTKNTLQAFVDFTLTDIGIRINGASVHSKEGKRWIGMPAREYMVGEKRNWAPIIEFANDEVRWSINDALLAEYDSYIGGTRQ